MAKRALFVFTFVLGALGLFGTATGILHYFSGNGFLHLLAGTGTLLASKILMVFGKRHWDFSRLDRQFARDISGAHLGDSPLTDKLAALEEAEEALLNYQARYREPGYDIMRVQALRSRIRALLKEDERLREHLRPDIAL